MTVVFLHAESTMWSPTAVLNIPAFLHQAASSCLDLAVSPHNPQRQGTPSIDLVYSPILAPFRLVFIQSSSTGFSDPLQTCHQAVAQSPAPALDSALPAAVAEGTHLRNSVAFRPAAYPLVEERACHQAVGTEERRCSLASRRWVEEMAVGRACRGRQLKTRCIVSSKQSNDVRYEREIAAYGVESLLGR